MRTPKSTATVCLAVLALLLAGCGGESPEGAEGSAEGSGGASPTASGSAARYSGASGGSAAVAGLRTIPIETSGGEPVEVRAEIADEPAEQSEGLMNRTALGEDRGMLFVFEEEQELSFWMRGTLIPLSIAYMDSGGTIVDLQDMEALDDEPPHYVSAEPAMYALEVNRGFFDERGVEVGDRADLPEQR